MESIAIVDDDINLCTVLSEELNDVGFETSYLSNGENVVEYVKDKNPDLVLLDLKIPGTDGLDVLKEISYHPRIKTKVIVITACADERSAIQSAKLGAQDFICKPYDFSELLSSIRRVLQKET